ncbi:universal stress protein [Chloroflexota bacterium]
MYQKILVPLDRSEFGECSLAHAKAIAIGCQVPEVVLLHVIEPTPQAGVIANEVGEDLMKNIDKEYKIKTEKYLSKTVDDLRSAGISATAEVVSGTADSEILDYAKKNKVDLIILSTHGSSGIVRWAMGSVTDRVIRHSPIPVLVAAPKACRIS